MLLLHFFLYIRDLSYYSTSHSYAIYLCTQLVIFAETFHNPGKPSRLCNSSLLQAVPGWLVTSPVTAPRSAVVPFTLRENVVAKLLSSMTSYDIFLNPWTTQRERKGEDILTKVAGSCKPAMKMSLFVQICYNYSYAYATIILVHTYTLWKTAIHIVIWIGLSIIRSSTTVPWCGPWSCDYISHTTRLRIAQLWDNCSEKVWFKLWKFYDDNQIKGAKQVRVRIIYISNQKCKFRLSTFGINFYFCHPMYY